MSDGSPPELTPVQSKDMYHIDGNDEIFYVILYVAVVELVLTQLMSGEVNVGLPEVLFLIEDNIEELPVKFPELFLMMTNSVEADIVVKNPEEGVIATTDQLICPRA